MLKKTIFDIDKPSKYSQKRDKYFEFIKSQILKILKTHNCLTPEIKADILKKDKKTLIIEDNFTIEDRSYDFSKQVFSDEIIEEIGRNIEASNNYRNERVYVDKYNEKIIFNRNKPKDPFILYGLEYPVDMKIAFQEGAFKLYKIRSSFDPAGDDYGSMKFIIFFREGVLACNYRYDNGPDDMPSSFDFKYYIKNENFDKALIVKKDKELIDQSLGLSFDLIYSWERKIKLRLNSNNPL